MRSLFPASPGCLRGLSVAPQKASAKQSEQFTNNRDRLLNTELMAKFRELLLVAPEVTSLLSAEGFSERCLHRGGQLLLAS